MNDITLVCFPHAGADASTYYRLANAISAQENGYLPLHVEIVNLPGRGRRLAEPLLKDLDQLTDDIFTQIWPWVMDRQYAFFGHSMGAWLAYLTAQKMHLQGLPLPKKLIVSGARPPRLGVNKRIYHLDQEAFVAEVEKMAGFPCELLQDAEAREYFLPILRADLEALGTYKAKPQAVLNVPFHVFRGTKDTVGKDDALAWRDETKHPIGFHEFEGSHFFVFEKLAEVARLTREILLHRPTADSSGSGKRGE